MTRLQLSRVHALAGANLWHSDQVLEAELRVDTPEMSAEALGKALSEQFVFAGYARALPAGSGYPTVADGVARAALALERVAGARVSYCGSRGPALAVEFEDEAMARPCLEAAARLCESLMRGETVDFAALVRHVKDLADTVCLGPSTRAIVEAARKRGIPARRLNHGSLVQLGQGARQRRIWAAETDATGSIGEMIAGDKQLSKQLLRAVGVPTPEGRIVQSPEAAWEAAQELDGPVVVKPMDGNHGRAVFLDLTGRDEIIHAFHEAMKEGTGVLVERCVSGAEHRLLVIGGELAAATRGDALYLTGDGTRSVEELLEEMNRDPRRGEDWDCPLSLLEFDNTTLAALAHQGYTPESVPGNGVRVLIQRNGNLSTDVTDLVHPDNAAIAVLAARTAGLDIAGIDVVADDIARPLLEQRGAVVEVNAGPGLQMHLQPASGQPRPVGEKIIGLAFPDGQDGRIPVAVIVGEESTELARAVAAELAARGIVTGLLCDEGAFAGGRPTPVRRAADLLLHPYLEAAVIQVTAESIVKDGLGVDRCQVAVVSGVAGPEIAGVLETALGAGGKMLLQPAEAREVVEALLLAGREVCPTGQ